MIFERIADKAFQLNTISDNYLFLYALLMANNPDMQLSFDDLINAADDDATIFKQYADFLKSEEEKRKMFAEDKEDEDNKKKD